MEGAWTQRVSLIIVKSPAGALSCVRKTAKQRPLAPPHNRPQTALERRNGTPIKRGTGTHNPHQGRHRHTHGEKEGAPERQQQQWQRRKHKASWPAIWMPRRA